jgi:biopolymer transport protein ExbB/TolQ
MQTVLEGFLYQASQIFLIPVLVAVVLLFLFSLYALGEFLWQARQRRVNERAGFDILTAWRNERRLTFMELETLAFKRLEALRIATRVAPMLGLVATMIPMGPALKGLADGQLSEVSANLTVAFSAVILALIAASLTYLVVNVRRRWYAEELLDVERQRGAGPALVAAGEEGMTGAIEALAEGTAK